MNYVPKEGLPALLQLQFAAVQPTLNVLTLNKYISNIQENSNPKPQSFTLF